MLATGSLIANRYRVVKYLGGGGMKHVYLVHDLNLASRPCALAEIVDNFPTPTARAQAVVAFQREAQLLATLSNEHIPHVYDALSENNVHFLVMEYIEGVTLEEMIADSGGKLGEVSVIDIGDPGSGGTRLSSRLRPSVIYRDLKPSNVMITPSGRVKLVDFGIARHFQPLKTATMVGTQGYAPPEQYKGKVEPRSDLYALGATIHHALSGRDPTTEPPFSFPPLQQVCPGCNPALANLVNDALAYKTESRVQSASEFRNRLLLLQGVESTTDRAPRPFPQQVAVANAEPRNYQPADSCFCGLCSDAGYQTKESDGNGSDRFQLPKPRVFQLQRLRGSSTQLRNLNREVSKNPKDLNAWLHLGHAKARAAEQETDAGAKDAENASALDAYQHALNIAPNDRGVLRGIAILNFRLGQYNEAIEASKRLP